MIRYNSKSNIVLFGILIIYFIISISHCEFKKPEAPIWDVELNIPLINKTYTMNDLADESKHLFISNEDSLLGLRIDGKFDTIKIGENLKIDDFDGHVGFHLGEFTLGNLGDPQIDEFLFSELWPQASQSNAPIPAFDIPPGITSELNYDNSFRMANIFDGIADVYITNNLPVDFQNLTLTLKGFDSIAGSDTVIGVINMIDGIAHGSTITKQLDLSGKSIPALMFWEIAGHSDGSGAQSVDINPLDSITLETVIANLVVRSALAKIPPIDLQREQMVELPEDVILNSARFLQGGVRIDVSNNTDLGAILQLTFPDLQNIISGQLLVDSLDMSPRSTDSLIVPLRFFSIVPEQPTAGQNQQLRIQIDGHTQGTGENYLTVTRDDSISITVSFVNLKLAYVQGVIPEQTIEIDTIETNLNLPDGLEKFQFSRALLVLDITNSIGLPMTIDASFVGADDAGNQISMPVNFEIQPGTPGNPVQTVVPFNQDNSNIVELLNQVPKEILFWGTATFGDGQSSTQLTTLDYFLGHFLFSTPFEFAWGADTVQFDTVKFLITPEDATDDIKENAEQRAENENATVLDGDLMTFLQSAYIKTNVTTRLPIGMELVFKISEDYSRLYDKPDVVAGPVQIPQGPPGRLDEPTSLKSEIGLTESDMNILKNSGTTIKDVFLGIELFIIGTNGEIVQVFASDYISIESMAVVVTNLDLQNEKN